MSLSSLFRRSKRRKKKVLAPPPSSCDLRDEPPPGAKNNHRDCPPRHSYATTVVAVVRVEPGPHPSRTICTGEWWSTIASPSCNYPPKITREADDCSFRPPCALSTPPHAPFAKVAPYPGGRPVRPRLSASQIPDGALPSHDAVVDGVMGLVLTSHKNYFSDDEKYRPLLEAGGALFSFSCKRGLLLPDEEDIVRSVSNLSSYDDEVKENFVPPFNVDDPDDLCRYTYVVQKCSYLLPGVASSSFANPDFLSTVEYHKSCQPVGTRVWTDVKEERTFRMTKAVIKYLFYMTVQFRVSALVDRAVLNGLEKIVGVPIDRAILLERNRRSKKRPKKLDGTAKAKSVLLYTDVEGGVLVTNITCILHMGIPSIVAHVVENFGSRGLGEVCETASRTRRYLREKFGAQKERGESLVANNCGTVDGSLGRSLAEVSLDATHTEMSVSFDCEE